MNKYGGTTTIMSTLPVGTSFYVCNGAWNGMITEKDGIKHIKIEESDKEKPIKDDLTLDINIVKKKYKVTYERTEIRTMVVEADSLDEAEQKYSEFDYISDRKESGEEAMWRIEQIG